MFALLPANTLQDTALASHPTTSPFRPPTGGIGHARADAAIRSVMSHGISRSARRLRTRRRGSAMFPVPRSLRSSTSVASQLYILRSATAASRAVLAAAEATVRMALAIPAEAPVPLHRAVLEAFTLPLAHLVFPTTRNDADAGQVRAVMTPPRNEGAPASAGTALLLPHLLAPVLLCTLWMQAWGPRPPAASSSRNSATQVFLSSAVLSAYVLRPCSAFPRKRRLHALLH